MDKKLTKYEFLSLLLNIFTFIAIMSGTVMAFLALKTYRSSNEVGMITILEQLDQKIYDMMIEEGNHFLLRLYYYEYEEPQKMTTETLNKGLMCLFDTEDVKFEWTTIPEFYDKYLISTKQYIKKSDYEKLLLAFALNERILYMV